MTEAEAEPLLWLQVAEVEDVVIPIGAGWVTVTVAEVLHPLLSNIVIEYVPALREDAELPVPAPEDQE